MKKKNFLNEPKKKNKCLNETNNQNSFSLNEEEKHDKSSSFEDLNLNHKTSNLKPKLNQSKHPLN